MPQRQCDGGERHMEYDNEMAVSFKAIGENEAFARTVVSAFILGLDPCVREMNDIKTAVSEAVTNSIIHGYDNKEGIVRMWCGICQATVYIEVTDEGKGIEDIALAMEPLYTGRPDMERSGLGFTIMQSFMDDVKVESAVGKGTRVFMVKEIGKPEQE